MHPGTRRGLLSLVCFLFAATAESAELQRARKSDACACATECRSTAHSSAAQEYWQLYHSANFTVCCPRSFDGDAAVRICETLRRSLGEKWLGNPVADWSSRCYVVLHPTATTYVQAAGRGSEATAGCSTVKELDGLVLSRRIDLRLDRPDPLSRTLPHELTHVLLADVMVGHKLPRWADEGMAMLADPQDKREGHRRDFIAALNRGAALRLPAMLTMDQYPEPQQTAAFYGQSLSLVEFLIQRKGSLTLQQFLARAAKDGYQKALDETYGIRDAHELERLWLANVDRVGPRRESLN
ncbi:MAG: hypothetical protein WD894_15610 [Pirellulales bacterium]